ncbi:hypothetical protein ASZ90_007504 [hydrocarbon metagenome]|uniref:Uncharacterized protein n=1 Tax=hydrocarbon metagenome TaxID=938273 RepID=A0A0W8FQW5_9ZZZZ
MLKNPSVVIPDPMPGECPVIGNPVFLFLDCPVKPGNDRRWAGFTSPAQIPASLCSWDSSPYASPDKIGISDFH